MINHKLISNFVLCLTLFFGSYVYAQQAPVFELPGKNKTINLENYRGKVVFLDFWASWCVPCRKSFPWMNDIQTRYGGENFTIIAINLDSSKADALRFLQKIPANFDIAFDPEGRVASKYNIKAMPSSYLIDRKGNLVFVHKGFRESDKNKVENKIKQLINAK